MDISAMSSVAAAQGLFAVAAQAASGVSGADAGTTDGSPAEAVQVAMLRKALDMERSLVNIFA
jgi:hypothetical protein